MPLQSDPSGPANHGQCLRAISLGAAAALVLSAGGALTLPFISHYLLWYGSEFYGQFAAIEPWWLVASAAFACVLLVMFRRAAATEDHEWPAWLRDRSRAGVALIAVAVFLIATAGTYLIFHGFYFADDEYSAWFQAVIFAHGKTSATLAPGWCQWIQAMTPTSIAMSGCSWKLSFLPIHSFIRSVFIALHIDHLAGPTIAAASVLLVAAIARKIWPAQPHRALIAAAIFGASTQLLFMSMTMYAMPTHLLFSLAWLWLLVEDTTWSVALLPWLGVAALGVHSPYPHGMWVMGFLLRYPLERRWGATACAAEDDSARGDRRPVCRDDLDAVGRGLAGR